MKYILLAAFLLIKVSVFSQTLSPEQDNAIKIEQVKLKEGKITYTEYQKRYDEIVAPKSQTTTTPAVVEPEKKPEVKSEPIAPAPQKTEESPAQNTPSQNTTSSPTVNQSPKHGIFSSTSSYNNNYSYRPGDQLIKFANKRYIAMGLFTGGYIFTTVGAIRLTSSLGTAGAGAILMGVACVGTSIGIIINSVSHIKKAGEYLNMQQDGAIK